jgi:hypothetical protein
MLSADHKKLNNKAKLALDFLGLDDKELEKGLFLNTRRRQY